jgi:hypothetical protein
MLIGRKNKIDVDVRNETRIHTNMISRIMHHVRFIRYISRTQIVVIAKGQLISSQWLNDHGNKELALELSLNNLLKFKTDERQKQIPLKEGT